MNQIVRAYRAGESKGEVFMIEYDTGSFLLLEQPEWAV